MEQVSEAASRSGTGSDSPTIPVTHANTSTLIRLLQVSAVHRGDAEKSVGPAFSPVLLVMFSLADWWEIQAFFPLSVFGV